MTLRVPSPTVAGLLAQVRNAARCLPPDAVAALVGDLAELSAELVLRPVAPTPETGTPDRTLSPTEAAAVLGRSRDWCYRHRYELPATQLPGRGWVIPETKLRAWMSRRAWRRA